MVYNRAQAQILRPRRLVIWREVEGFVDTRSSRPAKRLRRELAIRDELRYRACRRPATRLAVLLGQNRGRSRR